MPRSARCRSSATTAALPTVERLRSKPGGKHHAVVSDFVDTVRSGDWAAHDGSSAAKLAHIVDACYRSAREQREVELAGAQGEPGA